MLNVTLNADPVSTLLTNPVMCNAELGLIAPNEFAFEIKFEPPIVLPVNALEIPPSDAPDTVIVSPIVNACPSTSVLSGAPFSVNVMPSKLTLVTFCP